MEAPLVALAYRLPPEPSAPRVAVWRALRRLPGGYLADGVFVVEANARHRATLEGLAHDVRTYGGEAFVLGIAEVDDEPGLRAHLRRDDEPAGRRRP